MQDEREATTPNSGENLRGCAFCLMHKAGLCDAAKVRRQPSSPGVDNRRIEISAHSVRAGQMILHPREPSDFVMFICSGLAISSIALADGRRQIFEVLLPGDLVFWTVLFEPMSGRLIEALDDSTYRKVKRADFMNRLGAQPDLLDMFMRLCAQKKNQCDQLALTLGRRNASQRIARLILDLAERFSERGLMDDEAFRFPLRQRHIADATGLTPVHTSKVLRQIRGAKVIGFEHRLLRIFDAARLRQIAGP